MNFLTFSSLLLLNFFFLISFSQPITFQIKYGGAAAELANDVQQVTDGGYIVVGETASGIAGSNNDIFLLKTDSIGNIEWNRTFGGTDNEGGNAVEQTSDGGFILAGYTLQRGVLIKTDVNGDTTWTKTYQASTGGLFRFEDVQEIAGGGFICVGRASFGSGSEGFAMRTDHLGNVLWGRRYGETDRTEEFYQVLQLPSGEFVIGGRAIQGSDSDMLCLKLNAAGDTVWTKRYSNSFTDFCRSIQPTMDGGFILGGYSQMGSGSAGSTLRGCLLKLGAQGNLQWTKIYGSIRTEIQSVIQAENGDFLSILTQNGNRTFHLMRTDSLGNFLWSNDYPSTQIITGDAVVETSDHGIVMVGIDQPTNNQTSRDIILIKTDSIGISNCNETPFLFAENSWSLNLRDPLPTESVTMVNSGPIDFVNTLSITESVLCRFVTSIADELTTDLEVFPSPARSTLTISLGESFGRYEALRYELRDLLGNRVRQGVLAQAQDRHMVSVSGLASSMYFLAILNGDDLLGQRKIVKQ